MGEPALKIIETEQVESRALSVVDQSKAVKVIDAQTYITAGNLWKDIKAMIGEVKSTFDPICDAANKAHKAATTKRAQYLDPLEQAATDVKKLMSDYDDLQEKIRKEEEARLAKLAAEEAERQRQEELRILEEERKAEEERLFQAALEAEANGDKAQAEELMAVAEERTQEAAQVAAEIQAAPVYVPPVVVPKATPKLAGGPVYQVRWKHQVTNLMDLVKAVAAGRAPIQALQANDVFLGQQARSLKDAMNIPGVRAYSERV